MQDQHHRIQHLKKNMQHNFKIYDFVRGALLINPLSCKSLCSEPHLKFGQSNWNLNRMNSTYKFIDFRCLASRQELHNNDAYIYTT